MAAPRRENSPARVAKIYKDTGFSYNHGSHSRGDYKLSDGRFVSTSDDEKAQNTFRDRGYNKGKAKDMANNLNERVEKSIPEDSPASRNYEPSFSGLERHNTQAGDK